jgi:glycine dehydrogenase subunit 1
MSYVSLSEKDIREMMHVIGITSLDELFQAIPKEIKLNRSLDIPGPLSELDLLRYFEAIARKNKHEDYLSFLGAGAYRHFIPSIVDYLSSRGEFVSPYTPYQPEVSQGTLQIIFEFQTLICQLTGMDIANASLYDGASGAAEAVLMAHRLKRKPKILVARSLHPQYRHTICTYVKNLDINVVEIDFLESGRMDMNDLSAKLDDQTSAVIIQSPNFLGVIEDVEGITKEAHGQKALSVMIVAEPISLGILKAPGEHGIDIVAGEGQSLGIPLSFGGPYLGFMACAHEFTRQFPGRIAGQSKDVEGRTGYVLTLSTREQHIRRERATSNICTNQALCALRATLFMETLGKKGMRALAWQNVQKTHYALQELCKIDGVKQKFEGTFFNEFVLEFSRPWDEVQSFLKEKNIISGLGLERFYPELKNCVLCCVTEMHRKEEIDKLVGALREFMLERG